MIASLEDARRWCDSVRRAALAVRALGLKHWDELDWSGPLGRDERLRHLTAEELADWADTTLGDLDDLGVLVLFSVFEALVRARTAEDVATELPAAQHPALVHALDELHRSLASGSFARVTESFKAVDPELVEQVNQVRQYRNWVAHGRRGRRPEAVTPTVAYARLRRFLDVATPDR